MKSTRTLRARRGVLVLGVVAAAMFAVPQALAGARDAVYTQTNTVPNRVLAFDRHSDGTLGSAGSYLTGGDGKPVGNPPGGIPFLDSAGSVTLGENGQFLFVVNAGNNSISSFRVGPGGLQLADVEPSLGLRPVSSTSHGNLLYVLNSDAAIASISGYRVGSAGSLTPIPGSVRATSQPVGGLPAHIHFDAKGEFLAVTERFAGVQGTISTYAVDKDGVAGPPVAHPSARETPFGIAFTNQNLMIVSNESASNVILSSVSSYDLSRSGEVTPRDTEPANAGGACWSVITNNGKHVFVTSPFTGQINGFGIGKDGSLTPVTPTSVIAQEDGITLDEALSHDSRYLYVLVAGIVPDFFASARIAAYEVHGDGTIAPLGKTAAFEGSGSGAAAW